MKPDWDKLMSDFEGSKTVLVADVDCTADGKDLCEEHGIEGFPSIKHGDPADLEDYEGEREYTELKEFADGLGPSCSPTNLDLCDDAKKAMIDKFMAMSASELQAASAAKSAEMKEVESDFEKFVEGLQSSYEKAEKEKKEKLEAIKKSGMGLMKAVLASKGKEEL